MKNDNENVLINLFYSLCPTLITIMTHFNPSGISPLSPFKNWYEPILLSIILSGSFYFLLQFLLFLNKVKYFIINLFIQCLIITVTLIYLGLFFHRDYFSGLFLVTTIYYSAFLSKIDIFKPGKLFYKSIRYFSTIIIIVIFAWLLLMGYAIVKREEPRWIESITYNIYFIFLIVILYYKNFKISYLLKRKIEAFNDKILIDNFDLSEILNIDYVKILSVFFKRKQINCYELNKILMKENFNCKSECEQKAHLCNYYRNIYNKINYVKKILELLRVGTIRNPSNKRKIKDDGWVLSLEKDCIIEFKEK